MCYKIVHDVSSYKAFNIGHSSIPYRCILRSPLNFVVTDSHCILSFHLNLLRRHDEHDTGPLTTKHYLDLRFEILITIYSLKYKWYTFHVLVCKTVVEIPIIYFNCFRLILSLITCKMMLKLVAKSIYTGSFFFLRVVMGNVSHMWKIIQGRCKPLAFMFELFIWIV